MSTATKTSGSSIIPGLRYRNAPAAIDWLCSTFGFERQLVVPGDKGTIAHAQLTLGDGMVMIGSVTEDRFSKLFKHPDEIGMAETQSSYVVVSDADEVYRKAKAAGAQIVLEIEDKVFGGRGFSCRDLEGHLWSFGTFDPWKTS